MSDYICHEKLLKIIDYVISLHNNQISAKDLSKLLDVSRRTGTRLINRLDLIGYEFHNWEISKLMKGNSLFIRIKKK